MYENQSSHNEILALPSKWWLIDQNVLLLKKQSLRLTWICAHTFQRTAPRASGFFFSEPSCHVHDCVLGHSSLSTLPCFDLPSRRQRLTFYNSSTARMAKGGPPQVEVQFLTKCSIFISPFHTSLNSARFCQLYTPTWCMVDTALGLCCCYFDGIGDWTQSPVLAGQALSHWATSPAWLLHITFWCQIKWSFL